jgi:hypothetical protein
MVISHPYFTKTKKCALCKQVRDKAELQTFDGHLLCASCLRLVRDEGIVLPPDLENDSNPQ